MYKFRHRLLCTQSAYHLFLTLTTTDYDLVLIMHSKSFEYWRETLYKHVLGHLEAARSETKLAAKKLLLRKRLIVIDLIEGI